MYLLIAVVAIMVLGLKLFRYLQIKPRPRPKCLDDASLGVHKYFKSDGVKLHYVESGDPSKPLVMFVHGFPEFWYSWRHQIKHFNQEYHVVALDMRGYGDSEKPAGVPNYAIGHLVEDLKNLAEHVDKPKFHLVAHDWGGGVAWHFVSKYPEMVKSYTACNIPHVTSLRDQQRGSWEQMLKSWYMLFFQLPVLPEFMMMKQDNQCFYGIAKEAGLHKDEELINVYKFAFPDFTTWNRTINYYRAAVRSTIFKNPKSLPYMKGLKDIKVPCMSIFGTDDKYLSVDSAKGTNKYVKNHRLELVPGVSHWIQQEAPEKVNPLLQDFMKNNA
eukprot:TRINITY_DN18771_c0_g1_i4.p1 TRINITY_DN18771_c0_g1~~TRINITY_DN18771_c0_g1_i4.p1  ORF type:complete len:328 (-),score=42.67 TRINITY_DN18771_c0_g1_i4:70-1053(-)